MKLYNDTQVRASRAARILRTCTVEPLAEVTVCAQILQFLVEARVRKELVARKGEVLARVAHPFKNQPLLLKCRLQECSHTAQEGSRTTRLHDNLRRQSIMTHALTTVILRSMAGLNTIPSHKFWSANPSARFTDGRTGRLEAEKELS